MRPHYDASIPADRRAFQTEAVAQAIYQDGSDARLFQLEDEPIGKVPYSLLFAYEDVGQTRFAIQHQVVVRADGGLPEEVPQAIQAGLKWWAACPPVLINGKHEPEQYAILDYDLRHLFGFPEARDEEDTIKDLYQSFPDWAFPDWAFPDWAFPDWAFPDWEKWCDAIRQRLRGFSAYAKGYHAVLGLAKDELIVVHRINTIPEIAEELAGMGVQEAVLLDSGGSCAIWANWANGNEGGVLASHWNFRSARGSVVFLILKGERLRYFPKR